jgi:hypothetical protein
MKIQKFKRPKADNIVWIEKEFSRKVKNGKKIIVSLQELDPYLREDVLLMLLFRHRFGFLPTVPHPVVQQVLSIVIDEFNL